MQPTVLLAVLTTALLGSFPSSALAVPTEIGARSAQPAALLETRQYYDGPCSHTDCGVDRINCRDRRLWCVAYPSFDQPKGCTCSPL
ncbi:hypothetical protein SAMD00023353_2301190 [Rosellinia necatrix]|uniref:Uncharacterized protein n=1 Tax=Rosellinia necatrix TaxID=77044 RepID=A0A1S8A810_ROSNE|nr:hypothetical protein SAMD00023353_2301190 [Rosellinia necatrix]